MKDLVIAPESQLSLPAQSITETLAILGIRGSGKTNTAAVFAEELLKSRQQVVVIDPTDGWFGLKSSADGKSPGFPVVVLGGRHADLPLAAGDGRVIADFVVEQRASVVCSLRGFESKADEMRFVTAFLRRLYHLKGQMDNPTPMSVIIDEASRLIPQRVMGEDAACVGAVQQMVRQGRSSGFGVGLIDQRCASVNKDVLTQLEMLIVHRTTSPQDRKALKEWVEQHDSEGRGKEFLDSLASLKRGEAWVWSPTMNIFKRAQIRPRETFDSSYTPSAETSGSAKHNRALTAVAAVDVDALKIALAASLEKAKAEDPVELRKQIADLTKQLKLKAPVVDQTAIDAAVAAAVDDVRARAVAILRATDSELNNLHRITTEAVDQVASMQISLTEVVTKLRAPETQRLLRLPVAEGEPVKFATKRAPIAPTAKFPGAVIVTQRPASIAKSVSDLPVAQQAILNALAELKMLGVDLPTRVQLGAYAGYHLTGGGSAVHLTTLITNGYATSPEQGRVKITPAGEHKASGGGVPKSLEDLHQRVQKKLSESTAYVLRSLIDIYPRDITRGDLGEKVGLHLTGGGSAMHLTKLIDLGFATIPRKGYVAAAPILFPEFLS